MLTQVEGNLTCTVEEEYKEYQLWPTSGPTAAIGYVFLQCVGCCCFKLQPTFKER